MNISFASSTFQSAQVKPQTQAANAAAPKPKTMSSAGNIKDEYVPPQSATPVSLGNALKKMFAQPTFGAKPGMEVSVKTESRPIGRLYSEEVSETLNQVMDNVIESLDLHDKIVVDGKGVSFLEYKVDKDGRFLVSGNLAKLSSSELKAFEDALNKATLNGKPLGEHLKHVWNGSGASEFLEEQEKAIEKILGDFHRLLSEAGDVEQTDTNDQPDVTSAEESDTPEKAEETQSHQSE